MQILLSGRINKVKYSRSAIVMLGCSGQIVAYILTFINLPNRAVFGNTYDSAIIENKWVCFVDTWTHNY